MSDNRGEQKVNGVKKRKWGVKGKGNAIDVRNSNTVETNFI